MLKNDYSNPNIDLPIKVHSVSDIGLLVATIRKQQGLTQMDISGLAGVGGRFLVDLEKGKETIQMQKVMNVINLLGLEIIIKKKVANE